ncbi:hypothetical protein HTZ97_06780 [Desulfuromonas acetoxidans]|uniref:Uncharacterized protein n=1 Tax=Desulfuromonas acetoxidans (strain DSM 684 / 11070) TaxID=281689 RepID=Q1JVB6_DESA6|nr:hypothetical protein [Desulfuromonas acetoxidans]EAT14179.1 hypothetical protein Dace_0105 [Desulfuromonas acetoxidans DSM 684]MBF0646917.1 hypothetical protein [Desulfuromonas acetoxidans]NVD23868.1 hypothetical protein [Desulfuromonas acetoxidans]NVE16165.1 hypothetical protein [Desulfuromonas acetoxidans]
MSKKKHEIDPAQGVLDFAAKVDNYVQQKVDMASSVIVLPANGPENEDEINMMFAVSIKQAQRESGLSREQICDGVNAYLKRTEERYKEKQCRKPITVDMLNAYAAKPAEYPIDAYLLYAIQVVCDSLAPTKVLASSVHGQVVTQEEAKLAALGIIDEATMTLSRAKRRLKGTFS